MSAPAMLTAREAYALINQPSPLPGGTYSFCYDVLDLWGAKPVDRNSSANLVFMLSSVFAAGMEYANREGPSTASASAGKTTVCGVGACSWQPGISARTLWSSWPRLA